MTFIATPIDPRRTIAFRALGSLYAIFLFFFSAIQTAVFGPPNFSVMYLDQREDGAYVFSSPH